MIINIILTKHKINVKYFFLGKEIQDSRPDPIFWFPSN